MNMFGLQAREVTKKQTLLYRVREEVAIGTMAREPALVTQ